MNQKLLNNVKSHHKDFLFIPLGGTNEIGMNIALYHYLGKWLIVDSGTCFADDIPGVQMLYPDISFLLPYRNDVVGLVITHCHEDHIGSAYYVWEQIKCPIYSTRFTINFLHQKFPQLQKAKNASITALPFNSKLTLKPFQIEFASLSHSTIEMQSVLITTKEGSVFHTGDWKFDSKQVIGAKQNTDLLKSFGDKGVLALICDSTNSPRNNKQQSELELQNNLISIIKEMKNLVLVTTFVSNFIRLYSLFIAAKKTNRKIILSGRSVKKILETAKNSGYLEKIQKDMPEIVQEADFTKHKRENLLVIAAGCQGNSNSALSGIVEGSHKVKLHAEDNVIFSARIIPGNEKAISALVNKLVINNVNVITPDEEFVHVSGHPYQDELKTMYEFIKPQVSIPVHGDAFHINRHATFAKKIGIKQTIEPRNGVVIKLKHNESKLIGHVNSGYIALDGKCYLPLDAAILKTRKRIANDGTFIATIIIDSKKKKAIQFPSVAAPGCLDYKEDRKIIKKLKEQIKAIIINNFANKNLQSKIYTHVNQTIFAEKGKKPHIEINIEDTNL